jgi:hypothetical protein
VFVPGTDLAGTAQLTVVNPLPGCGAAEPYTVGP